MCKKIVKINELRSSILNLKDHLFISDLKKDIKEFVDQNVNVDENQIFSQVETILTFHLGFRERSYQGLKQI